MSTKRQLSYQLKEPLTKLINSYVLQPDNPRSVNIRSKLNDLNNTFPFYRAVRGDGNCFFMAVGLALVENVLLISNESDKKTNSMTLLRTINFYHSKMPALIELYDTTKVDRQMTRLNWIILTYGINNNPLPQKWRQIYMKTIDVMIYILRAVAIYEIIFRASDYTDIFSDETSTDLSPNKIIQRLSQYGTDAQDLDFRLISSRLNIQLKIYMIEPKGEIKLEGEGSSTSTTIEQKLPLVTMVAYPETPSQVNIPIINLIFRPGHYDILYKYKS